MAKESSFDVVSTIEMQEVDNAFQQAKKELSQRYDLKDSGAQISLDKAGKTMTIKAPSDFVAGQVVDIIGSKLVKRGIDLAAVKWGASQPAAGQSAHLHRAGPSHESAGHRSRHRAGRQHGRVYQHRRQPRVGLPGPRQHQGP